MTMHTSETQTTLPTGGPDRQPDTTRKPTTASRTRWGANRKAKSARKPKHRAKLAKAAKSAKRSQPPKTARQGSKFARVLNLLKRPDGATLKELMKATGWQAHSVRGFLSGTVGKTMGLALVSIRDEAGERRYSVKV